MNCWGSDERAARLGRRFFQEEPRGRTSGVCLSPGALPKTVRLEFALKGTHGWVRPTRAGGFPPLRNGRDRHPGSRTVRLTYIWRITVPGGVRNGGTHPRRWGERPKGCVERRTACRFGPLCPAGGPPPMKRVYRGTSNEDYLHRRTRDRWRSGRAPYGRCRQAPRA